MTTYKAEIANARDNRSKALLGVRALIKLRNSTEERRDELLPILTGEGEDLGILDLTAKEAHITYLASGRKTSTPDFEGDYKSNYIAHLESCVSGEGDGYGGLYPPETIYDTGYVASKTFNEDSVWVKGFSLESSDNATGTGLRQLADNLASDVGSEATNTSNARGPYDTLDEAQERASADGGSGYLGARTCNSEVYSAVDATTGLTVYYVGQNGVDDADDYSFKNELLSSIQNLYDELDFFSEECLALVELLSEEHPILKEFQVKMPSNEEELQSMSDTALDFKGQLEPYYDFFDSASGTSSMRDSINSNLNGLKSLLSDISNTFGSVDTVNALSDTTGKSLAYWVEELVMKPSGVYATLLALENSEPTQRANLEHMDYRLSLLEDDTNKWLDKPLVTGAFSQAEIGIDGQPVWSGLVSWSPILSANKYCIASLPLSELEEWSNDAWDREAFTEEMLSVNDAGFLKTQLDVDVPAEPILYRVIAREDGDSTNIPRADTLDSESEQSDILSDYVPIESFELYEGKTLLHIGADTIKEFGIGASSCLLLNDDTVSGVSRVYGDDVLLPSDMGDINSLRLVYGLYQVN